MDGGYDFDLRPGHSNAMIEQISCRPLALAMPFPLLCNNFIRQSRTWHMQNRPSHPIAGIARLKLRRSAYKREPRAITSSKNVGVSRESGSTVERPPHVPRTIWRFLRFNNSRHDSPPGKCFSSYRRNGIRNTDLWKGRFAEAVESVET
jgi:hypothetical protein